MLKYYTLYHTIDRGPDDDEDEKVIGIYSTEQLAERALERVKDKPGFRLPIGRFVICPCILDFDFWADGFGITDEDE
jgi:hypothetical protein